MAGRLDYHDIYYDGKSHYYVDGSVYRQGKLLLPAYDESKDKYYQVGDDGMMQGFLKKEEQEWQAEKLKTEEKII